MIDGTFIADEYDVLIDGKIFKGKCADVKLETKFDGLDEMTAFGIKVACQMGHKFDGGDYYVSMNGGESFRYSVDEYKMDGDRVVLLKPGGQVELSERDAGGLLSYKHGILSAVMTMPGSGDRIVIIFKKRE
jgi:hypothetical protein